MTTSLIAVLQHSPLIISGQIQHFLSTGVSVLLQTTGLDNLTRLKQIQSNREISTFSPHQAISQMNTFFCQIHYTITQTQLHCQNLRNITEVGRSDGEKCCVSLLKLVKKFIQMNWWMLMCSYYLWIIIIWWILTDDINELKTWWK